MFYNNSDLQVQYLINALELNQSTTILDIGCNNCIHLNKFEKLGYNIFGIDVKSNVFKSNIFNQNIFRFKPVFKFDCIYHLSLQLGKNFNNYDLLLKKYYEILVHNGFIVIDFMNYHAYLDSEQTSKETEFLIKNYHKTSNLFTCNAYNKSSGSFEYRSFWKVFTKLEFDILCQKNGFEIVSLDFNFQNKNNGNFEPRKDLDSTKNRLTVVLKKVL